MNWSVFYGILIPFLGTSFGAACVFFMKKEMGDRLQRMLTGFAAGVMVAASIWSLLIPAMEQVVDMGKLAFVPAVAGFWCGILFLLLLDHIIPHLHRNSQSAEGPKSQLKRTTMLVLAVTLHNIPEGMAVGVVYAGYLAGSPQISAAAAMALSLGIAIQNFPEGAIISMPLRAEGTGKPKAFLGGVLSGIVEPIGAILTILAAGLIGPAVSAQFCGGGNALCGRGGTDSGDVAGRALGCRHDIFCGGIQRHDDARCGAGLTLLLERADGFVSAGYENARKDSEKYTIETGVGTDESI